MQEARTHYTGSSADRLYLPRKRGGRGLISLELEFDLSMVRLATYVNGRGDLLTQLRDQWRYLGGFHRQTTLDVVQPTLGKLEVSVEQDESTGRLEWVMKNGSRIPVDQRRKSCTAMTRELSRNAIDTLEKQLRDRTIHGKYFRLTDKYGPQCHRWLNARLTTEMEAQVLRTQQGSVPTRHYRAKVMRLNESSRCRNCNGVETLEHVLSRCPRYSFTLYTDRHDEVALEVFRALLTRYGSKVEIPYRTKDFARTVQCSGGVVIEWAPVVLTGDRTIKNYKPDLLVTDSSLRKITIVEVAVCLDHLLEETNARKWRTYQLLAQALRQIYIGFEVTVVPVVVGAVGIYGQQLLEAMENLGLRDQVEGRSPQSIADNIQRTAILGSVRVVKNLLAQKV